MNNDLISREWIRKAVEEYRLKQAYDTEEAMRNTMVDWIEEDIDNAPTAIVESDILYLCDHKKCGENFNCHECNHTSDIRHAINFDLLEFSHSFFVEKARPQGKWGKHGECPFCSYIRQWDDDKFCGNCGADMRGDNDDG